MSEVLEVTQRELHGKLNNGRLRRTGKLPAVLYGHGKEPISLTLSADDLDATLRHGTKVVKLEGAADGQALLHAIQWDTFQQRVLHVDLLRVDAKERVQIEVTLLLRGVAPGENEGGVVEQLEHQLTIETDALHTPDQLHVNINHLHLGESLTAEDIIDLPPGAKVLGDPATVLVQCVEPLEEPEELTAEGDEPEVISRKAEDEEAAEE